MADSGPDTNMPDVPMMGDDNDSFGTADTIELGAEPTMGAVAVPGDLDYYTFEGTAGQWVVLATTANEEDDPEMVDTVVTLYDSSMTKIAENDDSFPRFNTDSELITRLPADGTYYVLVQEWSTWDGAMPAPDAPEGMGSFTYELTAFELPFTAEQFNEDAETGDDVASATALGYILDANGDFALVVGDFRDESDVDAFSFTIPTGRVSASFELMPVGADGNGSTVRPASITIVSEDGSEIIARVDPSEFEINPPLPEGRYIALVEHGGTAGAQDFYVFKSIRSTVENPPETMDATNGVALTAEPLTLEAVEDSPATDRAFIGATLGDGDTDFFSFEVTDATEVVSIFCGSLTAGSGVVGLEAALTDSTGVTVIAMETETAADGLAIEEQTVPSAGTYLLRLTKASQDAEVTGNWVRCGVLVGPPAE